jgi:hypothetical protein
MDINTCAQQQDVSYPAARFNEKGCLEVWEVEMLLILIGPSFTNEIQPILHPN